MNLATHVERHEAVSVVVDVAAVVVLLDLEDGDNLKAQDMWRSLRIGVEGGGSRVEGVTGRRRAGPEAGDGMRDEG